MTTLEAPTITVEELTEMFDGELGRCQMSLGFTFWPGRGFRVWSCKRPAKHVIVFTCPGCGTRRNRVCTPCLRDLKQTKLPPFGAPRCVRCRRKGVWKQ